MYVVYEKLLYIDARQSKDVYLVILDEMAINNGKNKNERDMEKRTSTFSSNYFV